VTPYLVISIGEAAIFLLGCAIFGFLIHKL